MPLKKIEQTTDCGGQNWYWNFYFCTTCGHPVVAGARSNYTMSEKCFPTTESVSEDIPKKARRYLSEAIASIHTPSGATMLCASAVDAMLKEKGFKDGKLYDRIFAARDSHLITKEMAEWAHEVRLDANDERHADDEAEDPTADDARKTLEFTMALSDFLFVLPARVTRGRDVKEPKPKGKK